MRCVGRAENDEASVDGAALEAAGLATHRLRAKGQLCDKEVSVPVAAQKVQERVMRKRERASRRRPERALQAGGVEVRVSVV